MPDSPTMVRRRRASAKADVRALLRSSTQPFFVSLAGLWRSEIIEGHWAVGSQLPTIDELAEQYCVARVTVRQAIGVLAQDRLVERIQGKGTFVASSIRRRKIVRLESSWQSFMQMLDGNLPEQLRVDPDCQAAPLGDGDGSAAPSYRYMRRLHYSGGEPYCVIDLYLDNTCYAMAPDRFDSEMVIPLLGRLLPRRLHKMSQSFRIRTADMEQARLLRLPLGAPIGEVRRVISDRKGRVVYLGTGYYRGDSVVFDTTLEVPR